MGFLSYQNFASAIGQQIVVLESFETRLSHTAQKVRPIAVFGGGRLVYSLWCT